MNWMRRAAAIVVLIGLAAAMGLGHAGALNVTEYVLFNGVNQADSTEMASPWIPIRGASRIYIRTWSAGATADTDFCDTIATWKTLFSDSVLLIVRDSLGTIVTVRSYTPSSAATFPMCADSLVVTNNAADSVKMVAVINPVQGTGKPVRGSVTGSGYYTIIRPNIVGGVMPLASGTSVEPPEAFFMTQYLRIRITPRTRLTTAGFNSTAGIRTRGVHALRMRAYVTYPNR